MNNESLLNRGKTHRIKYELPKHMYSTLSKLRLETVSIQDERLRNFLANTLTDDRLWSNGYNIAGRIIDHRDPVIVQAVIQTHWLHEDFDLSLMIIDDAIVGVTGVLDWDSDRLADPHSLIPLEELAPPSVRIGRTLIHPDFWGRMINQEVKLLILQEIFNFPVSDVNCNISATNVQSIRSSSNFGFVYCFPVDYYVNDEVKEFHRYSLFREDWAHAKAFNIAKLQAYYSSF